MELLISQKRIDELLDDEWIDTNHLGGYASSTLLCSHSRKYHGLLIANLSEPAGKYVMLSTLEDTLCHGQEELYLSAHQYQDFFQANGSIYLKKYIQKTHPCFYYESKHFKLVKEIMMLFDEDTVLIKYSLLDGDFDKLKIKPLIACRNIHELSSENTEINTEMHPCLQGYKHKAYPTLPTLFFQTDSEFIYSPQSNWYKNFKYEQEKKRGYDDREDLFTPGQFAFFFKKNEIYFSCSTTEQTLPLAKKWETEIKRRKRIYKSQDNDLQNVLKIASHSFIYKQPQTQSLAVTAGYHWFGEWGRDTLISLPGLTLYSDEWQKFIAILKHISKYENKGLLPNIISRDETNCAYNSVDASLWFGWALQQFYYKTSDLDIIKHFFWETLKKIYTHYVNGTLYNIKVQANEILYAGDHMTNVTWMDAVVAGVPISPRHGAAVEVNALWYNFLGFMNEISTKLDDPIHIQLKPQILKLKNSFSTTFWDEKRGYLKDFVNANEANNYIRPNQIFAVSLPYSPLDERQAKSVVNVVHKHLFTEYGLRTLAPQNKNYRSRYEGDVYSRDLAYHNGSIWPWLLTPFAESLLKTSSDKKTVLHILQPCLKALKEHLACAGIGTISELFDGDFPHHPRGCISQAWSVGEVLRLIYLIQ